MAIASPNGFIGGSNASPEIATFPMGMTSRGGNGFLTGATAHILDADSPMSISIVNPASAINQDIPTSGVLAGRQFLLQVSGATETNYVAFRSSGGNEIDRIGGAGFIFVEALIDNPTTAAHWRVIDAYERTGVITSIPTGANTQTVSMILMRRQRMASFFTSQPAVAAAASPNITLPAGSIPARFRSPTTFWASTVVINNSSQFSGICQIVADGSVVFFKSDLTNFTGLSGVSPNNSYVSYSI